MLLAAGSPVFAPTRRDLGGSYTGEGFVGSAISSSPGSWRPVASPLTGVNREASGTDTLQDF